MQHTSTTKAKGKDSKLLKLARKVKSIAQNTEQRNKKRVE